MQRASLLLLFLIGCWAPSLRAQTSINEMDVLEGCEGVLTDTGGSAGPYSGNESEMITLCPSAGDTTVWIEWQVFELDPLSQITVHDGDSELAPILVQGTNTQLAGSIFIASEANPSGCLTIAFESGDGSEGNFAASIHCGQPCAVPVPVLNANRPPPLRVCPGEEVIFDGSDSYTTSAADIVTWNWDWDGDGEDEETSDLAFVSHTFDDPGIVRVQMSLVDSEGCESIELTNYIVHVSNEPIWDLDPTSRTACTGEEVNLFANVVGQEYTLAPSVDFGDGLYIPDSVGVCFASNLTFNQFIPGQLIQDASAEVEELFMNFEHSWMGDLTVSFICPNGQSIQVHNQSGGGTFLGVPVDDDQDPNTPGEGFDYSWTPEAMNGTWGENLGGTLPAGAYESYQTFANLNGCPLNGVWQLEICDLLGSDNGFVFDWAIQFADSLYPAEQSFTPLFGLECDSTSWETPLQDDHLLLEGDWNCAEATVTMSDPGTHVYTAFATNNFGCEYSQEIEVEYVAFSPRIESSPDVYCGGVPVELTAVVNADTTGEATFSWSPAEFLSSTSGESVMASGMSDPEQFNVTVAYEFDGFNGLLCEAVASFVVGTCEILIPNAITPYDSFGKNDMFRIPGIESYRDVELVILNRWGSKVYENDDFGAGAFWDPAGDKASSGVYYYVLTIPVDNGPLVVTSIDGEKVEYLGEGPFVLEGIFHVVD